MTHATTKLAHGPAAYLRSMQMSSMSLWVFVEGRTDVYFYRKIVDAAQQERGSNVAAIVVSVGEIDGYANGQVSLHAWLDYLRAKGGLVSVMGGKRTIAKLFADKDVVDVVGGRKRSPHITYTEYYTEGYSGSHEITK